MSFQTPITIAMAINNIECHRYLLPSIQREFIWDAHKIEWLYDSLLRKYPVSSFLFWRVEGTTAKNYKFYEFIKEYRERYQTHNSEFSTEGIGSFDAILDGQQRLTAIHLGLKGSFAYKEYRKKWENTESSIPTRRLYLNIKSMLDSQQEEDGRIYNFEFLKDIDTNRGDIHQDEWFRVGKILDLQNLADFNGYVTENRLSPSSINIMANLQEAIFSEQSINFFLQQEQDLNKALNIFIRINSGGEPLSFSDLIMSIAVANWETKDARKEIYKLVDDIREKGFGISKDLILKIFLFLYSKDIGFKVTNFSKDNAKDFEKKWEKIRDAILSTFTLINTYGFTDFTLTSKNAIIPIVYYIYHRDIYKGYSSKVSFKSEREEIKKWLHIVLIKRILGGNSDTVLGQIRRAFTSDVSKLKIKPSATIFPVKEIFKNIRKNTTVDDDFIEEILYSQKDDKYTFSILSLLYPDLDYKNNNFHKDHLHPSASFGQLSDALKEKYDWSVYNSIYNLQMLDANENESKSDKTLKEWIDTQTEKTDRDAFLVNHNIPNVDLSLDNFEEYLEKRKKILIAKLKKALT